VATLAAAFIDRGSSTSTTSPSTRSILAAGIPSFPRVHRRFQLALIEARSFAGGSELLRYEAR
jgi:hypothetical protein